jgi:hypothetical protein
LWSCPSEPSGPRTLWRQRRLRNRAKLESQRAEIDKSIEAGKANADAAQNQVESRWDETRRSVATVRAVLDEAEYAVIDAAVARADADQVAHHG